MPVQVPGDIIDPFYRALYKQLTEDMENRVNALAHGSAFRTRGDSEASSDPQSVKEKYARSVGYLEGVEAVLTTCRDIQARMYGGNPGDRHGGDDR